MAQDTTNGQTTPRRRGRPPKQAAAAKPAKAQLELSFSTKDWADFLRAYEPALSDLREAQADCREAKKTAGEKGIHRMAMDFVMKLRGRVSSDKLTAAEAMAVIDQVRFLAEVEFDAAAGIERMRRESESSLVPAA